MCLACEEANLYRRWPLIQVIARGEMPEDFSEEELRAYITEQKVSLAKQQGEIQQLTRDLAACQASCQQPPQPPDQELAIGDRVQAGVGIMQDRQQSHKKLATLSS